MTNISNQYPSTKEISNLSSLTDHLFESRSFQLYKISLDQNTLNLVDALLMEMSVCSISQQNIHLEQHECKTLADGLLKILEWRLKGTVNEGEFSFLYMEWLKSKQMPLNNHPLDYHYEELISKNHLLNYLRYSLPSSSSLSQTLGFYMELLNNQLNQQLQMGLNASQYQIEIVEDIYILLDGQGTGYLGIDQLMFFYMALLKKKKFSMPRSRDEFHEGFSQFANSMPHIHGRIPLRSIKTYLIVTLPPIKELESLLQICKDLLNEFGWSTSKEDPTFPRPFNEAFVQSMDYLYSEGHINEQDIIRDEFLNIYNIFLNEEFLKTATMFSEEESLTCLGIAKPQQIEKMLFCASSVFYNERVLQSLGIKLQQIVFQAFGRKFEERVQWYVSQFMQKYGSFSKQSVNSDFDGRKSPNQVIIKSSKVFSKQKVIDKENYIPQINFLENTSSSLSKIINGSATRASVSQQDYNSWKNNFESGSGPKECISNRSNLPHFQNQPSYLDGLQSNINRNIQEAVKSKNGKNNNGIAGFQTNQPDFAAKKHQLFSVFTQQLPPSQLNQKNEHLLNFKEKSNQIGQSSPFRQQREQTLHSQQNIQNQQKKPPPIIEARQSQRLSRQSLPINSYTRNSSEGIHFEGNDKKKDMAGFDTNSFRRQNAENDKIKTSNTSIHKPQISQRGCSSNSNSGVVHNNNHINGSSRNNSNNNNNNFNMESSSKKKRSSLAMNRNNSSALEQKTPDKRRTSTNSSGIGLQRSKSPQVKRCSTQNHKRIESYEKVMQRLTSQNGVSPLDKKKHFV